MPLSPITSITLEDIPQDLSSFLRGGVVYVVWTTKMANGSSRLQWKPHSGADFTETAPQFLIGATSITTIYLSGDDTLFAVWSVPETINGALYSAKFNPLTGALVSGPTLIGDGSNPRLAYSPSLPGADFHLYATFPKSAAAYGRFSLDLGLTWSTAIPLLTNKVRETSFIEVIPYDDKHVIVAQVGSDSRQMQEVGLLKRTRPLSSIVKHPTLANKFFVSEPSRRGVTETDNLRGGLLLSDDSATLYHLDGSVAGTSDSIGAVALITKTGFALSVDASAGPGTSDGDDFSRYTLVPALSSTVEFTGTTGIAVSMGTTASFVYVAEYNDTSATSGALAVLRLSDNVSSAFLSSISGRAIGIGKFGSNYRIFAATTESGIERLRVYTENGLTPTLVVNYKMPSRVNNIQAVMASATTGTLYVSMVDRLNVYAYNEGQPLILRDYYQFSGGGQFFKVAIATNGTVFAACGSSGIVAILPEKGVVAHMNVSSIETVSWKPNTAYSLNTLVRPRPQSPGYSSGYYFKCTTAGTSGNSEPDWALTGTILDNTAQWQPQGMAGGIATDLVLDETSRLIFVVGSVGGTQGTNGRVWVLDSGGLI